MLSEDEIHELEILAHLEEKDFNNNTCDKSYIDLVMNAGKKSFKIITKLQKENEEKDANIAKLNEYLERISQDLDNVAIDQIPIAIAELKYKDDLKDKQIDLMAIRLLVDIIGDYPCKYKENCSKSDKNYRDIHCRECIKQYFETKAKEGE